MKLFNSKTSRIEDFKSLEPGKVSMYVCGPTVYNYAHIGNARPLVVFDVLRRVLEAIGYEVDYVSNYTDIDDKIINKAHEEETTESVIAQRYIDAYEHLRQALHATGLTAKPRVTQTIPEIIAFIKELVDQGYAYQVDGDVYFRVHRIKDYGEISHQNIEALLVGSRIEANDQKENPLDFVLWKKTDDGISWDSPWGAGRPGWHTECVVMIHDHFHNDCIDIHGGGYDLRFPHHENESAQNKALHHHDLANYWVHNAMVNFDGEKMSKSLGNVVWAQDYVASLGGNVTRWILLSTHYRLILNITDALVEQSQKELQRIEEVLKRAEVALELEAVERHSQKDDLRYHVFMEAMMDDMNVANAQAVLFELVKTLNQELRKRPLDFESLQLKVNALKAMLDVLGIVFDTIQLTEEDRILYMKWHDAKLNRLFDEADIYRAQLMERGII